MDFAIAGSSTSVCIAAINESRPNRVENQGAPPRRQKGFVVELLPQQKHILLGPQHDPIEGFVIAPQAGLRRWVHWSTAIKLARVGLSQGAWNVMDCRRLVVEAATVPDS